MRKSRCCFELYSLFIHITEEGQTVSVWGGKEGLLPFLRLMAMKVEKSEIQSFFKLILNFY